MTSDQKIVKVSLGEPVGFMIWCENRSSQLAEATYQSFFLTTYSSQHFNSIVHQYWLIIVLSLLLFLPLITVFFSPLIIVFSLQLHSLMNSSMELWRLLEKLSVTVHYQVRESFHMIKNLVSVSHRTFFLRRGVLKTKTSKTPTKWLWTPVVRVKKLSESSSI